MKIYVTLLIIVGVIPFIIGAEKICAVRRGDVNGTGTTRAHTPTDVIEDAFNTNNYNQVHPVKIYAICIYTFMKKIFNFNNAVYIHSN